MKVLYADAGADNPWAGTRRPEGIETERIETIDEACERLEDGIDCVVTGGELPDGDAFDLLESVRESAGEVPFVLYADGVSDTTIADLIEDEFTDYVPANGAASEQVLAQRVRGLVRVAETAAHEAAVGQDASEAAVTVDPDGTIRHASGAVQRVFERSPPELKGTSLAEVLEGAPELLDRVDATPTDLDVVVRRPDGDEERVAATVRAVPHPGGSLVSFVFDAREPTHPAKEELDEVMTRVTDAFHAIDDDWRFTYLNERAEELLQRPREELIGTNIWDEFTEAVGSPFHEAYETAMETQEPQSVRAYYPPLEYWFDVRAYPSPSGLSVYFRDVTEEKQADDQLRVTREVSREAANADSLEEGLAVAVEAIGTHADWSYCEAWLPDGDDLVRADTWVHNPVETVAEEATTETVRGDTDRLGRGEGLVGRAVTGGETVRGTLEDRGMDTGVAVPVRHEGEVVAVILVGLHVAREDLDRLVGTVETVARDLERLADRLEARAARRRKERQFDATFEDPASNIVLLDAEGNMERFNANAKDAFDGRGGPEAWRGRPFTEHPWWEDAQRGPAEIGAVLDRVADGEYVRFETTNDQLYDDRTAFDASIRPVFDDDGTVVGMIAAAVDITERYRAQDRRRREERYFDAIFEDPDNVIALLDPDGTLTRVNERARGLTADDPVGAKYWDIPWWEGSSYTEATVREWVDRVANGEHVHFETANEDLEDGPLAFDVWMRPVHDEDGAVDAILAEARDVTDRYLAEAERRRKERQFDAIFEDPDNVVMLLDPDGRVRRTNATAVDISPLDAEELVGSPLWELPWWSGTDTDPEEVREWVERAAAGEAVQYESTNDVLEAEPLAFNTWLRPVFDGDEVESLVLDARDISSRFQLEQRLREERNLNRRILETSPVGIAIVAADGTIEYLNDRGTELFGAELESAADVPPLLDADGVRLDPDDRIFRRVVDDGERVIGAEVGIEFDTGVRWFSVNGVRLDDDRAVLTFEDVTEQRERAARLAELAEEMKALPGEETREAVAASAVETARSVLGLPEACVALYDEEDGRLVAVPGSDDALRGWLSQPPVDSPAWQAFVESDAVQEDDRLAYPIGDEGVFLSTTDEGVDRTTVQSVALLVTNLQTALARADREEALRDQTEALEARTEELERVEQVNGIIRQLTGSLIQASNRQEVETAACESFTADGPYQMAWVGRYDPGTSRLVPSARAGEGTDFLDDVEIRADDSPMGRGPAGRAFRTREVQVVNDLYRDDSAEVWRRDALRRNFRSIIAVPLRHRDSSYGVLVLYADEPNVFGDMEREVFDELGETVGYAINALERKKALVGDRSVELEVAAPLGELQLFDFLAETDATFTYENLVPRSDGNVHLFFRIEDLRPEAVFEAMEPNELVDRVALLEGDEEGARYEALLRPISMPANLLDRGFVLHAVETDGDEMRLTVRIPVGADAHDVLELFRDAFGEVDLRSKREVTEPVRARKDFEEAYFADLTERQEEVLRTAYSAGFFEWPRVSTGQDVADMLGVSQPTVNRHVRTAERKLFRQLLDGE